MKKIILSIAALLCLASCTETSIPNRQLLAQVVVEDSVYVCHKVAVRGGAVYQTLYIPKSKEAIHLAHGDSQGPCN